MVTRIYHEPDPAPPPPNGRMRAIAIVAVALLALVVGWAIVNAQRSSAARDEAIAREVHTMRVLLVSQQLLSAIQDGETGQRGFLLTGDPRFLAPYLAARKAGPELLDELARLTRDNPVQVANSAKLRVLTAQRWAQMRERVELVQSGRGGAAITKLRTGDGLRTMTAIRAVIADVDAEEQRLLAQRRIAAEAATAAAHRYLVVLSVLGVGALLALAIAAMALLQTRDGRVAARAQAVALARVREGRDLLQSVIDSSQDPIYVKDRDGRLVLVNAKLAELSGSSIEGMLGKFDREFSSPVTLESSLAADAQLYATGEPQVAEVMPVSGADQVFLTAKVPWRRGGNIVGIIGVARDITTLKRAEETLRLSNAELEARVAERTAELTRALDSLQAEVAQRSQAEAQVRQMQKMESIGQLTGGIAHDFNNMLAIILGSLEMARRRLRGDEDPRIAQLIGNAEEGATRAATLTARLLAFARQQPLAPEPVDANKLVAGMSELLRRTLGEHIEIETVLAGGLWRSFADAAQLENALVNLAVNARDAMAGGGKLTIETANGYLDEAYAAANPDAAPGQYVVICVTDTGEGMPPEVIERAFDPFFTTKPAGQGTGLGLSQVFGYVKQTGGHVKIYSEVAVGTTVKLYLPRHTGALDAVAPAARETLPRGAAHEHVLVVEDDAHVRTLAVEALHELGYTAMSAASPGEALELLGRAPAVALLFTDVVMPQMTGRQLADEALRRWPDLRVLYTTGYTRNAVVHNGMVDPGVAFLPKPYTFEALARKVRSVLDTAPAGPRAPS